MAKPPLNGNCGTENLYLCTKGCLHAPWTCHRPYCAYGMCWKKKMQSTQH